MEVGIQDAVFLDSEGNKWFNRNKNAITAFDPENDPPLRLIEMYKISPQNVLEIGASNGYRVAYLSDHFGAEAVALDPSAEAIKDGRARYPQVKYVHALAHDIPLDGKFDLIIMNFVLHWIGRQYLLRAVSEVDRLLENDGYLLIGDFSPHSPTRVKYHHLSDKDIYTFKQDYAAVFLSSAMYEQIAMVTGAHNTTIPIGNVPSAEKTGIWLLRKNIQEFYATDEFPT